MGFSVGLGKGLGLVFGVRLVNIMVTIGNLPQSNRCRSVACVVEPPWYIPHNCKIRSCIGHEHHENTCIAMQTALLKCTLL